MAKVTGWSKRGHGNTQCKAVRLCYGGGQFKGVVTFDIALDDGEKVSTVILTREEVVALKNQLDTFITQFCKEGEVK